MIRSTQLLLTAFACSLLGLRPNQEVLPGGIVGHQIDSMGVRVDRVLRGSPSESSGIRSGDIILGVEGLPFTGAGDFRNAMKSITADPKILQVRRDSVVIGVLLYSGENANPHANAVEQPRSCAIYCLDRQANAWVECACQIAKAKICNGCASR